jgi:phosphatidylserine decarboxylase
VSGWIIRGISLLKRPRGFVHFCIRWFIRKYSINCSVVAKPVDEYSCLLDFFLRELKPEARPFSSDPAVVVSPVDAEITACGTACSNKIILVKGTPYSVAELLGRPAGCYAGGRYVMLYLSPADCHRIYAPVDAGVAGSWYIDGGLKPVFPAAVKHYPRTFITNKRVITELESKNGMIAIVKIGATNVGRIPVCHPLPFTENDTFSYRKGEELGRFEFGSTVVLLFETGKFHLAEDINEGRKIKIGEALARVS